MIKINDVDIIKELTPWYRPPKIVCLHRRYEIDNLNQVYFCLDCKATWNAFGGDPSSILYKR